MPLASGTLQTLPSWNRWKDLAKGSEQPALEDVTEIDHLNPRCLIASLPGDNGCTIDRLRKIWHGPSHEASVTVSHDSKSVTTRSSQHHQHHRHYMSEIIAVSMFWGSGQWTRGVPFDHWPSQHWINWTIRIDQWSCVLRCQVSPGISAILRFTTAW